MSGHALHQQDTTTSLADTALARSRLYAAVADAFFDPTAALVRGLTGGSFGAEVGELVARVSTTAALPDSTHGMMDALATLSRDCAAGSPEATLRDLKVEFARLFLGPGRPAVSPYETLHVRRNKDSAPTLMISREAVDVQKAYREAGVVLSNLQHEPPDHFATECEFMCYLCAQEAESISSGDPAGAEVWRQRQRAFLEQHLGRWYSSFLAAVADDARTEYYRLMARLAAAFVSADLVAAELDHLVPAPA